MYPFVVPSITCGITSIGAKHIGAESMGTGDTRPHGFFNLPGRSVPPTFLALGSNY